MKRLRPAVALLFQVLLLQVSVLGGGMACAPAWTGLAVTSLGAPAERGGHQHGAGHHGSSDVATATSAEVVTEASADAATDAPADGPPSRRGPAPSHCLTVAGCAAAAGVAPELTLASPAAVHSSAEVGRVSLPASTHPAPEPPPPRA